MSRLLRLDDVLAKIGGLSRSTIYRLERDGFFPKRRVIKPKIVRWDETEIDNWIKAQTTGCGLIPGTRKADMIACTRQTCETGGTPE